MNTNSNHHYKNEMKCGYRKTENFISITKTGINDRNQFEFRFFKRPNGGKYVQIWKHYGWPYQFSDKILITEKQFMWFLNKIRTCPLSAIERCDEMQLYYHRDCHDVHLIKMDSIIKYETSAHLIIEMNLFETVNEYSIRNQFRELDEMCEYSDDLRKEVNFAKRLYDPILELEIDKIFNKNEMDNF